ncbi:ATP-binding protein [Marinospirillum perlucidum]|uniref:sensor histidine kinase n=1 Tax=Marinospirillum perlucidum TaxID=1982602 RepID=UPI000DF3F0A0|nr:ATP-binding protein [Marinospirillum perlucidum]
MNSWLEKMEALQRRLPLLSGLASGLITFLLLFLLLSLFKSNLLSQEERKLAEVRSRLESTLNQASNASASFSFYIASQPVSDLDFSRFQALAEQLLARHPMIRNMALAPDNIILWNFPVAENSSTHGLNLAAIPEQARALDLLKQSRRPVLAGPIDLVQGGSAIIHRVPVFINLADGGSDYWGTVGTAIRLEYLLEKSGAQALLDQGDLAIRGQDGQGSDGATFLGSDDFFSSPSTLKMAVRALDGEWQLALRPVTATPLWSLLLVACILIGLLVAWLTFRLTRQLLLQQMQLNEKRRDAAEAGERLQLATQAAGMGIWDLNLKTGEIHWDAGMFSIFQQDPAHFSGTNQEWEAALLPGEKERIYSKLSRYLESGGDFEDEFRIRRPDGKLRLIRNHARIIRGQDGEVEQLVGINEDITSRRQEEARLLAAKKEEERLNYIMAHHFQEPSRRLMIFADQLRQDSSLQVGYRSRQAIDFIREQASYLRALVQSIQTYMQAGSYLEPPKKLSLPQLIENLLASDELVVDLRSYVTLVATPWPEIEGPQRKLQRLVKELLNNAWQHSHCEGSLRVEISARCLGDRLEVTFSDNGVGLHPDQYEQALDLMVHLDEIKGRQLGMGLPLARKLVLQMEGKLFLESSRLGGLAVVIDLPLASTNKEPQE